jgi:hypothetical protein
MAPHGFPVCLTKVGTYLHKYSSIRFEFILIFLIGLCSTHFQETQNQSYLCIYNNNDVIILYYIIILPMLQIEWIKMINLCWCMFSQDKKQYVSLIVPCSVI